MAYRVAKRCHSTLVIQNYYADEQTAGTKEQKSPEAPKPEPEPDRRRIARRAPSAGKAAAQ